MTKPEWIRRRVSADSFQETVSQTLRRERLNTICEQGCCPNRQECFAEGVATFLILGSCCTRDCAFCSVKPGRPEPVDPDEPARVAESAKSMGLNFAVVTSVTRDDLPDGGAGHFARVIRALGQLDKPIKAEVLTPDFQGSEENLAIVLEAKPQVLAHNVETVPRIYERVRPLADYHTSLGLLRKAADNRQGILVKSGLMVGLGETRQEVEAVMNDLHEAGCQMLTIGQYLRPTKRQTPVVEYVEPTVFESYREYAEGLGFMAVASAPFVRSSYLAEKYYNATQT